MRLLPGRAPAQAWAGQPGVAADAKSAQGFAAPADHGASRKKKCGLASFSFSRQVTRDRHGGGARRCIGDVRLIFSCAAGLLLRRQRVAPVQLRVNPCSTSVFAVEGGATPGKNGNEARPKAPPAPRRAARRRRLARERARPRLQRPLERRRLLRPVAAGRGGRVPGETARTAPAHGRGAAAGAGRGGVDGRALFSRDQTFGRGGR